MVISDGTVAEFDTPENLLSASPQSLYAALVEESAS
jgi:ABC-type multidrug transport system fused ATPase/permease subunit